MTNKKSKILITGSAGFIGFHLTRRLLNDGFDIVGLDSINDYYDINLKYARLAQTGIYCAKETDYSGGKNRNYKQIQFKEKITSITNPSYRFIRLNLEDKEGIFQLFKDEQFDYVINLAAQAGVRYSIENPDAYIHSNIIGFLNILEACRHYPVKHHVYASSSSVYGANAKIPFSEDDMVDTPVSLYAATKKSNELMSHTYSHLYKIPTTGLRFFTVYGPWGRPDMAPMLFANAIRKKESINIFNNGEMERDFTYIDDIVEGIKRVTLIPSTDVIPYRIINIGNGNPVKLMKFIKVLEKSFSKNTTKTFMPMQDGDVKKTWADVDKLKSLTNYQTKTSIEKGVNHFALWYNSFYG